MNNFKNQTAAQELNDIAQDAKTHNPIYLDNQASTPLDPRVLEVMIPYFTSRFGNPHSSSHVYGDIALQGVEEARAHIAQVINAQPKEICFTSGATESNNLALKGTLEYYSKLGKNHLIVTQTEHKCVLLTARYLESQGYSVTYLPVNSSGLIDLKELEEAITDKTALVSVLAVNNETGVIQPLEKIGECCRKHSVLFHTDAAQAVGKIPLDVERMKIDLLSISSHKIYGPKGIGCLYIRRSKPRVRLVPQMHGGGQERGMRSGTLSPALCAGFGEACRLASAEMNERNQHISSLSAYFIEEIMKEIPKVYLNGKDAPRVPHTVNLSFAGIEGESMILALENIAAISTGSACSSASLEGSYVLKAMGIDASLAHTTLRFGIGKDNTKEELTSVINGLKQITHKLRQMSPLWDMIEEGIDLNTIKWHEH